MKFVCLSDTHLRHDRLPIPGGDVLIHAGDMTNRGGLDELARFNDFLAALPHPHKIVIAGNHDFAFERQPEKARALITNAVYLQDSETTVNGVRIYGSPWQPWFMNWAFNLWLASQRRAKWDLIPEGIDILVTHGPPYGRGDQVERWHSRGRRVGCKELTKAVQRLKPKYHLFGHIHEGYGITRDDHTVYVNASLCDEHYNPVNPPIVFDYP